MRLQYTGACAKTLFWDRSLRQRIAGRGYVPDFLAESIDALYDHDTGFGDFLIPETHSATLFEGVYGDLCKQ